MALWAESNSRLPTPAVKRLRQQLEVKVIARQKQKRKQILLRKFKYSGELEIYMEPVAAERKAFIPQCKIGINLHSNSQRGNRKKPSVTTIELFLLGY